MKEWIYRAGTLLKNCRAGSDVPSKFFDFHPQTPLGIRITLSYNLCLWFLTKSRHFLW